MNRFQKSKLVVISSCLVLFSLSLLGLSTQSWFRESRLFTPIVDLISRCDEWLAKSTNFLSQTASDIDLLLNAYDENKVLKENISELKQIASQDQSLLSENESLRQSLKLTETYDKQPHLVAEVLFRNPDSWSHLMGLDKGHRDGVNQDMLVLANGGLIGKISELGEVSTKVSLLTDETSELNLAIRINGEQPVYGILTGYDADKGVYIVAQLNQEAGISEGASVVTSDLSENFAENIPVGEVVGIKKHANSLDTELYIKPAADFNNIYSVVLVGK